MEAKLKLISDRIPWSLACKAAVFAVAWFYSPFSWFVVVALAMYLSPFFQPFLVAVPFGFLLIIMSLLLPNFWIAAYCGIIFFLLLGIKDLVFVYRLQAYQFTTFLLYLLLTVRFLVDAKTFMDERSLAAAFLFSIVFFILGKSLVDYQARVAGEELSITGLKTGAVALSALMLWEFVIVLLFLPIPFLFQVSYLFVVGVVLLDITLDYTARSLVKKNLLLRIIFLLIMTVLILGLNQWGL